jgi:hypothetical protein
MDKSWPFPEDNRENAIRNLNLQLSTQKDLPHTIKCNPADHITATQVFVKQTIIQIVEDASVQQGTFLLVY